MGCLIRHERHEGHWYFSVIDVIVVLTDSDAPRRYWNDLKRKLHDDGFSQLYDLFVQLIRRSLPEGKMCLTATADMHAMLLIDTLSAIQRRPISDPSHFQRGVARVCRVMAG